MNAQLHAKGLHDLVDLSSEVAAQCRVDLLEDHRYITAFASQLNVTRRTLHRCSR